MSTVGCRFKSVGTLIIPLLGALAACDHSRDVYAHGPWSKAMDIPSTRSLYTSPWNAPIDAALLEEAPAPAPLSFHGRHDGLEPIGPWATRGRPPYLAETVETSEITVPSAPLAVSPHAQPPDASMVQAAGRTTPEVPTPSAPRTVSSFTGHWTTRDGPVACATSLSSTPALDLYRASTSRCASAELRSVNAWAWREGRIVLYARGKVVASLEEREGSFQGTLPGTGARISLSR